LGPLCHFLLLLLWFSFVFLLFSKHFPILRFHAFWSIDLGLIVLLLNCILLKILLIDLAWIFDMFWSVSCLYWFLFLLKCKKTFCISPQAWPSIKSFALYFKHFFLWLVTQRMVDKVIRLFCNLRSRSCLWFLWQCIMRLSGSFNRLASRLRLVVAYSWICLWSIFLNRVSLWDSFTLKFRDYFSAIILEIVLFFSRFWWKMCWEIDWR